MKGFIILIEDQDLEDGWFEYDSMVEAEAAAETFALSGSNVDRNVRIYEAVRDYKVVPAPRLTVTNLREPKSKTEAGR